jgi:methyl-accepting chemotaxis protein/methyl-accepting chemotaxis protein-1 (serine sensor receptor)
MEFKKMSSATIGKKLSLAVGTQVVLTFALGIAAFAGISSIGDRMRAMVEVTVGRQTLAHAMDRDASFSMGATKGILMRGLQKDRAGIERNVQDFNACADSLQNDINRMQALDPQPETALALRDLEDALNAGRLSNSSLWKAAEGGDMATAFSLYDNAIKPLEAREKQDATRMLEVQETDLGQAERTAQSMVGGCRWGIGLLLLLSCGAGVALVFGIRQINGVLRNAVVELAESAAQIVSAAGQVAASSQSLAQGASEQTATIEETSSASAEINSMARRTTENSRSTAEMVTRSQEGFEKANQSLTEMVDAMDGINASSQKISKIIKVIDEIAFQTNILALNAAVEAARAGEAGMGFAVVADEVRNLAQRCAQAAKDTADLIEDSIQKSDGGRVKVDQVSVAIRAITADSSKIKVLVDEISLGSVEQSSGIDQISRAINQMEQVTQSSAANAQQSAAAAEQLNAQAEAMKDVVETLRAMVDGGSGARGAAKDRSGRVTPGNAQWARLEG